MASYPELEGRVAVITGIGGAGSIGRAVAAALAEQGVHIACVDIDADAATSAATEIEALGVRSIAVVADVTRDDAVARMVDETAAAFGAVDILVNNAGGSQAHATVSDITPDEWHHVLDLNLTSVFLCSRAVLAGMVARGSGRIINVSSQAPGGGHDLVGHRPAADHQLAGALRRGQGWCDLAHPVPRPRGRTIGCHRQRRRSRYHDHPTSRPPPRRAVEGGAGAAAAAARRPGGSRPGHLDVPARRVLDGCSQDEERRPAEVFGSHGAGCRPQDRHHLDVDDRIAMKPGLVWYIDGQPAAVIDA